MGKYTFLYMLTVIRERGLFTVMDLINNIVPVIKSQLDQG